MAQHQRKHYRRRRRFRFTRAYGVLSVLLILAAIVAGCIVFFRVDTVEVEGVERYTKEQILSVADIESGDNMFLLNKFDVIDRLESEFTYVDEVVIRRKLPSTIRISVTECTVAAAVRDEGTGEWWLISSGGKLLEKMTGTGVYFQITGLTLVEPTVGQPMAVGEEQRLQLDALTQILPSMQARELLSQARTMDLTSASTVHLYYADRLEVKMKLSSDFDYQMRVLAKVMEEYVLAKWDEGDTGVLDLTLDDGLPHLRKNVA